MADFLSMTKEEFEKHLADNYPLLYVNMHGDPSVTCMAFGVEIGPGWYQLVDDLSQELEELIEKQILAPLPGEVHAAAAQVKEKFGTLRYYMDFETDEMYKLTSKFENLSETTCECCGEKGKLRTGGWLYTLCDECYKKRQEKRRAPWLD